MEKRAYSVEWLSESSHRNTAYPNVDLLACRSGASALQLHKEISNEKESHTDNTAELCQVQRTETEAHDATISRGVFKEVSTHNPSSERYHSTDTDSAKSPGSLSEEDASSRPRTKFTKEQLQELEKSFKEHRYIGSNEKKRLSKVLKLSETQIKTWFQNRRMKFKRQSQDARVEAFFSGLYVPYYDFQTPGFPARPGLAMPLAHPTSIHPFAPVSATVIRPGNPPSSMPPANLRSYPCPSVLMHPSLNEAVGLRFSPY